MTIVVEDGTGLSNAVSYATVAQYKAYCDARGISYSGVTDAVIEQSLVKSTDAMVQMYRARWKGYRNTATQALDWPRSMVYLEPFVFGAVGSYPYLVDDATVPTEVINACIKLAIEVQSAELITNLEPAVIREKIDVIEVEYDINALPYTQYRAVDLMLQPFLSGGGGQLPIVR